MERGYPPQIVQMPFKNAQNRLTIFRKAWGAVMARNRRKTPLRRSARRQGMAAGRFYVPVNGIKRRKVVY
jgi:hypothetical protein